MNYEEMLTWVLFYTSIFDIGEKPDGRRRRSRRPRPQPGDRERPTAALRLTLNGAENSRTIAGHFIARNLRLQRPAPRLRLVRHFCDRRRHDRRRLPHPRNSTPTTTTTSPPASAWMMPSPASSRTAQHPLRPRRRRRILPGLRPDASVRASSSRSSSGAATAATAAPMPPSASPHKSERCIQRPRGSELKRMFWARGGLADAVAQGHPG